MKASKFLVSTVTTMAVVGAIAMAYAQTGADDTTGTPSSRMDSSVGTPESKPSDATGAMPSGANMSDERAPRSDRN